MAEILLRRSNKPGGNYFMPQNTGHWIHSYQWQELPITDTVIDRVEEMYTLEESSEIIYGYPNFDWIPGNKITDGYDNEDIIYKTTDDASEYKHIERVQD